MPTYLVRGADRETGENRSVELEAPSEPDAELLAQARGILVSKVIVKVTAAEMRQELVDRRGLEVQRHEAPERAPPKRRTAGHDQAAPTVNVHLPRRGGSLGISAIVLGAVALLICWIPIVNLISLPLAGVGVLLAIIGFLAALTRRGAGIGFAVAGGLLCVIAGTVAVAVNVAISETVKAVDQAVTEANREARVRREATPSPAPGTDANPPTIAEPAVVLIDAGKPALLGEMETWISRARVDQVSIRRAFPRDLAKTEDRFLILDLRIRNISEQRKIDYVTWRALADADGLILRDELGNEYSAELSNQFSLDMPEGGIGTESVYPGDSVTDVLIFERPVAAAKTLRLDLSGAAFGETEWVRFRIPTDWIEDSESGG